MGQSARQRPATRGPDFGIFQGILLKWPNSIAFMAKKNFFGEARPINRLDGWLCPAGWPNKVEKANNLKRIKKL
jgi:hypothetical protein